MARPKTYIIKLSDDERAEILKTIHNKKTSRTILKRCQILLELDEVHGTGLTHAQLVPLECLLLIAISAIFSYI